MTSSPNPDSPIIPLVTGVKGSTLGEIADFYSILGDLTFARDCAALYLERIHIGGADAPDTTARALWVSACISYRRLFVKGKGHLDKGRPRQRLKDGWKNHLTPEQLSAHESVHQSAMQHIAHRADDSEQIRFVALLAPPPMEQAVLGLQSLMASMVGPDHELPARFISLCDLLIAVTEQHVSQMVDDAVQKLSNTDLAPLYAAAEVPPVVE